MNSKYQYGDNWEPKITHVSSIVSINLGGYVTWCHTDRAKREEEVLLHALYLISFVKNWRWSCQMATLGAAAADASGWL